MKQAKLKELIKDVCHEAVDLFDCKVILDINGDSFTFTNEVDDAITFVAADADQAGKTGMHRTIDQDFDEYNLIDLIDECNRSGHRQVYLHSA